MYLCELDCVTKIFDADEKVCPIDELSLQIGPGEFIAIEGPSGIGKSTLLYILGGLLRPTSGTVYIVGEDTSKMSDQHLTLVRSANVGFIFQEANLFPALTVLENVEFSISLRNRRKGTKGELENAKYILQALGLGERMDFLPYKLSVGQRRRVSVARALVNNAEILIADEPTNDLDPYWAEQVMKLLYQQVVADKAVIMVTHHAQWAQWASRRLILKQGKVVEYTKVANDQ